MQPKPKVFLKFYNLEMQIKAFSLNTYVVRDLQSILDPQEESIKEAPPAWKVLAVDHSDSGRICHNQMGEILTLTAWKMLDHRS